MLRLQEAFSERVRRAIEEESPELDTMELGLKGSWKFSLLGTGLTQK